MICCAKTKSSTLSRSRFLRFLLQRMLRRAGTMSWVTRLIKFLKANFLPRLLIYSISRSRYGLLPGLFLCVTQTRLRQPCSGRKRKRMSLFWGNRPNKVKRERSKVMSCTLLSGASPFSSIVLIKHHWVLSNYSINKWMNPVELFGKRQKQSGIGREEDTRGWWGVLSLTWESCQCACSALCDVTMGCFCRSACFNMHFLKSETCKGHKWLAFLISKIRTHTGIHISWRLHNMRPLKKVPVFALGPLAFKKNV